MCSRSSCMHPAVLVQKKGRASWQPATKGAPQAAQGQQRRQPAGRHLEPCLLAPLSSLNIGFAIAPVSAVRTLLTQSRAQAVAKLAQMLVAAPHSRSIALPRLWNRSRASASGDHGAGSSGAQPSPPPPPPPPPQPSRQQEQQQERSAPWAMSAYYTKKLERRTGARTAGRGGGLLRDAVLMVSTAASHHGCMPRTLPLHPPCPRFNPIHPLPPCRQPGQHPEQPRHDCRGPRLDARRPAAPGGRGAGAAAGGRPRRAAGAGACWASGRACVPVCGASLARSGFLQPAACSAWMPRPLPRHPPPPLHPHATHRWASCRCCCPAWAPCCGA